MSQQHNYLARLVSSCYYARDNHCSDEKLQQLFDEAEPFSNVPVVGIAVAQAIKERNLSKLAGALGMCLSIDNGEQTKVVATAIANSESHATSFSSVCAVLDKIDSLDDDTRREIRSLMNELDGEKDESIAKSAAKKLMETVIEKCVDALPSIAPFVAEAIKGAMC